ncbi:MAG: GNAT family N-acetyltransferase [Bacteroidia bacterium]|nr:GNAT family N-acetyltransferase [Bacteroidia bacterium]
MINKITPLTLTAVAKVHKEVYLKNHFSSLMSPQKTEEFYSYQIAHNEHCYSYTFNNEIVAFIISGKNTNKAVNSFIMNNKLYLLFVTISNPRFLLQKAKQFISVLLSNNKEKFEIQPFRLLSVAASSKVQGKGVVVRFFNEYHSVLKTHGINSYGLSVKSDNTRAIKLYEKLGFEIEHIEKTSIYYKITL